MAQKEGKEGAIDNGQWVNIPRNTRGEIQEQDPSTGYCVILFPLKGQPMQVPSPIYAAIARAYIEPEYLTLVNRGGLSTPFVFNRAQQGLA